MTPPEDPRVTIVRRWLGEDNPYERADKLLAELDAVRCAQSLDAEPTEEDVERVAAAVFLADIDSNTTFAPHERWLDQGAFVKDGYRELARAALTAWRRK